MNWKHGLLIVSAIGLLALVYFAPKVPKGGFKAKEEAHAHGSFNIKSYVDSLSGKLPVAAREKVLEIDAAKNATPEQFDTTIEILDKAMMPIGAAYYGKLKAEQTNTSQDWYNAGDRFLVSAQGAPRVEVLQAAYENATQCFEKALELDPNNLNAKAGLGITYVESAQLTGQPPMKGIGLLKQVVDLDSNNTIALMNLGKFSIQSGQLDLAEQRFKKVLEVDPNIGEAFVYLAEISLKQDNKENAIYYLEQYRKTVTDERMITEIDRESENLRTKN